MLVVDGRDKLKRQYLDLCNWNRSNSEFRMPGKPEIFFKEDKERKSENIIDTKKKIYELQGKVFECTESELQAYCMTFDVRNYQALNVNEMRTILLDMKTLMEKYLSPKKNIKFILITVKLKY